MEFDQITRFITESFDDVHMADSSGNLFFFHGPYEGQGAKMPFATLVTSEEYDNLSQLSRPGVFRLNVGASKTDFEALPGVADGQHHDFTALDVLMPHPIYGSMYWVCVLNPSEATFETVKPLLAKAHGRDAARLAKTARS